MCFTKTLHGMKKVMHGSLIAALFSVALFFNPQVSQAQIDAKIKTFRSHLFEFKQIMEEEILTQYPEASPLLKEIRRYLKITRRITIGIDDIRKMHNAFLRTVKSLSMNSNLSESTRAKLSALHQKSSQLTF